MRTRPVDPRRLLPATSVARSTGRFDSEPFHSARMCKRVPRELFSNAARLRATGGRRSDSKLRATRILACDASDPAQVVARGARREITGDNGLVFLAIRRRTLPREDGTRHCSSIRRGEPDACERNWKIWSDGDAGEFVDELERVLLATW